MYPNDKVVLVPLTEKDAASFHALYSHPQLLESFGESPFLPGETPLAFTRRILSLCECIYTIRSGDDPQRIIGDCALHHWNRETQEIQIGGSLFPACWGRGFMQAAFDLLSKFALNERGVQALLASTQTWNTKAIRLVEKMGFRSYRVDGGEILLRKELQ